MEREESASLLGGGKQRLCDSLFREKKDSNLTFHLESQSGEKTRNKRPGERLGKKTLSLLLISGLLTFWLYCLLPRSRSPKGDDLLDEHTYAYGWSWESIKPSSELAWHQCFDELECARLEAWSPPGGPGGSGVRTVKDRGKAIHVAVSSNHVGLIYRDIKNITNGTDWILLVLIPVALVPLHPLPIAGMNLG
ncbi:hypothetical protein EYC80_001646 [Monilinia laxa]|uniref:Uncharacterized protein n=1 Tax=Monilinia laxa TaxID=61186 RepID=A0A5N6K5N8_MONLA|nr:hypothetical protein EYC80_001646 [Monilinia laxa]